MTVQNYMQQRNAAPILNTGNKQDRTNEKFQEFQNHLGIGKEGNIRREDGGLYDNKFRGMNQGTDGKEFQENMLVNEEEASDKLPPNMPNYDPFLEAEKRNTQQQR